MIEAILTDLVAHYTVRVIDNIMDQGVHTYLIASIKKPEETPYERAIKQAFYEALTPIFHQATRGRSEAEQVQIAETLRNLAPGWSGILGGHPSTGLGGRGLPGHPGLLA
jgi:hypothetical protein